MKVLITGINGFVGTYFKQELASLNHEVFGLDTVSNSPNTMAVDIMDEEILTAAVQKINPDYIFHLAGIANVDHPNKSLLYDINFRGTLNMLNACISTNPMPRFVFISSAQVYGNVPPECQPIDESCPVHPINHYGASKAAAEMAVMSFGCEYNLEYMILRPFNHTGPGQTDKFVVPKIVNAFKRRENVLHLGNTHTIRDFTDVRDVARAYSAIVSHFRNAEVYNIASGKGITIDAIIGHLVKITGRPINIEKMDMLVRKSEILSVSGNADKFSQDTGWSPACDIEATLKAMLAD